MVVRNVSGSGSEVAGWDCLGCHGCIGGEYNATELEIWLHVDSVLSSLPNIPTFVLQHNSKHPPKKIPPPQVEPKNLHQSHSYISKTKGLYTTYEKSGQRFGVTSNAL